MGHGSWSDESFKSYSSTAGYESKTTHQIFQSKRIHPSLDPKNVGIRESRDSADNPKSTAIILGLDVTGSMGNLATVMAKEGLNTLCKALYDKRPVSDPHIMCMGIGDLEWDNAPLQVSQFEADLRILEQLEKIFIEGGGGGNSYESYTLPWYFAAKHTSIDCFEKRGKKGFIFTIGDEDPTPKLHVSGIERVIGDNIQSPLSAKELLKMVSEKYEVFHLMVEEGNHYRSAGETVRQNWTDLLGQRAIPLADHTKMAQVITTIIQVHEGMDLEEATKSWDKKTGTIVKASMGHYKRVVELGP